MIEDRSARHRLWNKIQCRATWLAFFFHQQMPFILCELGSRQHCRYFCGQTSSLVNPLLYNSVPAQFKLPWFELTLPQNCLRLLHLHSINFTIRGALGGGGGICSPCHNFIPSLKTLVGHMLTYCIVSPPLTS